MIKIPNKPNNQKFKIIITRNISFINNNAFKMIKMIIKDEYKKYKPLLKRMK